MACYVYIMFRHDDGSPFYVGKGTGRRWEDHIRKPDRQRNIAKAAIIKRALESGRDVPVVIVAADLDPEDALKIERAYIAAIGRKPFGPLVNMTDGGEGFRGLARSEEHRAKIGAAHRGKRLPDDLRLQCCKNLEAARKAFLALPPERWAEAAAKGLRKKSPDDRRRWQKTAWETRISNSPGETERMSALGRASMTPEKTKMAVAAAASRTPAQKSEAARKANASRTPDQRSLATKKGWETRLARKAMSDGAASLHTR